MNIRVVKTCVSYLLAALLVGGVVYGIARLLGSSPEKATDFAFIAVVVGLLEQPMTWLIRRAGILKKERKPDIRR